MDKDVQVSIIIPTYDYKDDIFNCIDSVKSSDFKNIEIIVIDNGSNDGTAQALKRFEDITLVESQKNLGVSGGRNAGIKYISGSSRYILFLDHDITLEKNTITELLKVSNADSEIGIITPKIYYKENKRVVWAAGTWIDMTTGRTLFNEGPDKGQFDKITDVQVAPAVIFTRRDIINKIGGFDEIYFAVYEDADFCMRARKAGFRIVYTPFAIAYHNIPKDRSASMKHLLSMSYYVGRNRILFMKKFSNNYFIFLFFLPFYIIYYFVLSIRYLRFSCFIGYLRGTRSGLLTPVNKLVKIDVN